MLHILPICFIANSFPLWSSTYRGGKLVGEGWVMNRTRIFAAMFLLSLCLGSLAQSPADWSATRPKVMEALSAKEPDITLLEQYSEAAMRAGQLQDAVAICQGWGKVTGKPLAAVVHSNVGLMHATMAIFNAWCDRIPMLMLGGVGPLDAMKRRHLLGWLALAGTSPASLLGCGVLLSCMYCRRRRTRCTSCTCAPRRTRCRRSSIIPT